MSPVSGQGRSRSGTLLIIVAGISALLLSMSLAFLVRMRSDGEESKQVVQETQARIMLVAGLHYIQESSRLGWDRPGTPQHEEAYGWVDVRDSSPGPKDRNGTPLYRVGSGFFPDIGGKAARCPMYVEEIPPFATKATFAYNPAPHDASLGWRDLVNYTHADPQPVAKTWDQFVAGNPQPRTNSQGLAWFRIYRERNDPGSTVAKEPATFIITCGAGPSMGFRSYQEAIDEGLTGNFGNDPRFFLDLRGDERLLWYRVEWTSAVGGSSEGDAALISSSDPWRLAAINSGIDASHWWVNRNLVGSFLWIQRLESEPTEW